MKVLVLTSKPPLPARDGGCLAHLAFLRLLSKCGIQFDTFSLSSFKHPFEKELYLQHPFIKSMQALAVDTAIRPLPALSSLVSRIPYNIQRFFSSAHLQELVQHVHNKDYNFVILDGINSLAYRNGFQKTGLKIIYRSHNREAEIWKGRAREENNLFKKAYLHRLATQVQNFESQATLACHAVIYISESDRLNENKTYFTLPFTLETEPNFHPPSINSKSFFFLGALDWEPNLSGLEFFVSEIWKPFMQVCPEAVFHIAGRGMSHVPDFFKAKGIVFHGEIEQANDFRKSHGISVAPLFSGSGMRVKLLESMLEGVPIMASIKAAEGIMLSDADVFINDRADQWRRYMEGIYHGEIVQNTSLNYKIVQQHYSDEAYLAGFKSFLAGLN